MEIGFLWKSKGTYTKAQKSPDAFVALGIEAYFIFSLKNFFFGLRISVCFLNNRLMPACELLFQIFSNQQVKFLAGFGGDDLRVRDQCCG